MSTLYVNNIQPVSGSALTLISASLVSVNELVISGITSSFQGNLQGTASFATTASHALNSTSPSGVVGSIQFSDGSAFSSDATNFFWDNTNKRLGIGTNAPSNITEIVSQELSSGNNGGQIAVRQINGPSAIIGIQGGGWASLGFWAIGRYTTSATPDLRILGASGNVGINNGNNLLVGSNPSNSARVSIQGSGTTSATTSLLVQNSSATELMRAYDDGKTKIGVNAYLNAADPYTPSPPFSVLDQVDGILAINQQTQYASYIGGTRNGSTGDTSLSLFGLGTGGGYIGSIRFWTSSNTRTPSLAMIVDRNQSVGIGLTNSTNLFVNLSAKLQVDSTTQGFLPPRMTTTQRDAIVTPATGLKVYNTTTNTTDTYDGTTWQRFGQQTFIKGSGSTSATTSLLVQNSAGSAGLRIYDNLDATIGNVTYAGITISVSTGGINTYSVADRHLFQTFDGSTYGTRMQIKGNQVAIGTTSPSVSAILQIDSTTMGFLLPRTNLTSNISTPAQGLQTYLTGSTNEGLYYYNSGSYQGWTRVLNNSGSQNIAGTLTITGSATNSLLVIGSGSTSATTSLLVQNSAGNPALTVKDDLTVELNSPNGTLNSLQLISSAGRLRLSPYGSATYGQIIQSTNAAGGAYNALSFWSSNLLAEISGTMHIATTAGSFSSSAKLQVDSTTQGFLPPRMTTTQRDAIATPATGLKVYNTTTNTTDTYDGSTWQRFGQQTFIKGSGTTSATTSLLVQNSSGQNALEIKDDKSVGIRSDIQAIFSNSGQAGQNNGLRILVLGSGRTYMDGWSDGALKTSNYPIVIGSRSNQNGSSIAGSTTQENGTPVVCGSDVYDTSAQVQINSTTRGFLPPRMTTTQKNAIATPAAGLVVYDTTTNKLCCYDGSIWNDLF